MSLNSGITLEGGEDAQSCVTVREAIPNLVSNSQSMGGIMQAISFKHTHCERLRAQ